MIATNPEIKKIRKSNNFFMNGQADFVSIFGYVGERLCFKLNPHKGHASPTVSTSTSHFLQCIILSRPFIAYDFYILNALFLQSLYHVAFDFITQIVSRKA